MLMRCISKHDGRKLLKEIHSGICGNHAASRTSVGKAYRQGFFCPTAITDTDELVRKCEGCQYFARQIHVPAQELQTIPITWPFAVGVSIWLAPCRERLVVILTSSSPSINSPSGSKPN